MRSPESMLDNAINVIFQAHALAYYVTVTKLRAMAEGAADRQAWALRRNLEFSVRRYGEAGASPHVNVGCRQE